MTKFEECESCGAELDPDNDDMIAKLCADCIDDANTDDDDEASKLPA